MKKARLIAALIAGLFGVAAFATAVQMARARMEGNAAETVKAVRADELLQVAATVRGQIAKSKELAR